MFLACRLGFHFQIKFQMKNKRHRLKSLATKSKSKSTTSPPPQQPPPWEVIDLIAPRLDPKTLAIASCVSKSWQICMSSDRVWQKFCTIHYPSFSQLKLENPFISYHHLYSLASIAAGRRLKKPDKPKIPLGDLIFIIVLSRKDDNYPILNIKKSGGEFNLRHGMFLFNIEVNRNNNYDVPGNVKASWHVLLKDWSRVFTMMDCEGEVRFEAGRQLGFGRLLFDELPSPGCCCGGDSVSRLLPDLQLWLSKGENGLMKIEKLSVGIVSMEKWRHVSVDNGLRYLQHFLLT